MDKLVKNAVMGQIEATAVSACDFSFDFHILKIAQQL